MHAIENIKLRLTVAALPLLGSAFIELLSVMDTITVDVNLALTLPLSTNAEARKLSF